MEIEKLRVLFMQSQTFWGADTALHATLMRHFDHDRIEVHVACSEPHPAYAGSVYDRVSQIPGVRVRATRFGPSANSRPLRRVLRDTFTEGLPSLFSLIGLALYIRRHKIQIIHGTEKPRDTFYGFLLARMTGAKYVAHLHVKYEHWIRRSTRWAMRHADGIIAISRFVADSAIANGIPPARVHVVLNAQDMYGWETTVDGSGVRQEFGIAPETTVMSLIARIYHWKGHTRLLRALALVHQKEPAFRVLIVGEDDPRGDGRKGSYTEELQAFAHDLGIQDNVIFTGFRRDIRQIMAATDIFTMPSYEEPFGMVFLEAMAMRVPVVALNNGGTPEVVLHGRTGLLSESEDDEALASNILTLMQNSALRREMGAAGRRRVQEVFGPHQYATRCEAVYRRILGKPAPVPSAPAVEIAPIAGLAADAHSGRLPA